MGTTKDIRDTVNAELRFDPLVDDADIRVVNAGGDVALNGTVSSYPQYLEAAAAAQRVGGVKNVHNHLEVVLPDADVRDDAMLTTAANNALTLNVTVPDGVEAIAQDGLLPRLGGLTHEAAGLRHARPALLAAAVASQAVSLGCYALLYRQVLAGLGARVRFRPAADEARVACIAQFL